MSRPLLAVRDLAVHFPVSVGRILRRRRLVLKAVDGVSFELGSGETLGVVGESGCGKSTLGRAVLRLIEPTGGRVLWLGEDLGGLRAEAMRRRRRDMQIVFQDPLAALDPRMTVGDAIAEPLLTHAPQTTKTEVKARVAEMMARTGLSPQMINRYPHEFSGGQCQRIGIARALMPSPRLIVCDEPVSALDVSIRAQIVNLLAGLQRELGVALIFISHDLSVVRHISHRILVLYLGRTMELADREALFHAPRHPYTRALISAVPVPDPKAERARRRIALPGEPPSPLAPPSGCVFRTRCPHAAEICARELPAIEHIGPAHRVACHRWRDL